MVILINLDKIFSARMALFNQKLATSPNQNQKSKKNIKIMNKSSNN
jgi:hypothetical protein